MSAPMHPIAQALTAHEDAQGMLQQCQALSAAHHLLDALLADPQESGRLRPFWHYYRVEEGQLVVTSEGKMMLGDGSDVPWLCPFVRHESVKGGFANGWSRLTFDFPPVTPELVATLLDPRQEPEVIELTQRYLVPNMEVADAS